MTIECKVEKMKREHVTPSVKIWKEQYGLYCNNKAFPEYWRTNTSEIEGYLNEMIDAEKAIAAIIDGRVAGFLTYDEFDFNGEASSFCPAIGHAAIEECKELVYLSLYKYISQKWVEKNVFNHLWMIFFNDIKLKNLLFDLGFGSHLIDAFSNLDMKQDRQTEYKITAANAGNVDELYELVKESELYYGSAPIFLRRPEATKENVSEMISKGTVFVAWDKGTAIGFMNLSVSESSDTEALFDKSNGLIDEIGAYIKPEYRSKGIGSSFLKVIGDHCRRNNIPTVHVDFETANPYANKFWRKYFDPMLISMRRTINKNINI
jgi:GNAT superfamily N-acetyltransferase